MRDKHFLASRTALDRVEGRIDAAIGEFTTEDLRIMIGQNIGLPFPVPIALETLENDPLSEGDLYPGDLLKSVLTAERDFWAREPALRDRVAALLDSLESVPDTIHRAAETFRSGTG